jgi:hypothetical protein
MSAPSEIDGNASIAAFLSCLQNYGGLGRSPMNGSVEIIYGRPADGSRQVLIMAGRSGSFASYILRSSVV